MRVNEVNILPSNMRINVLQHSNTQGLIRFKDNKWIPEKFKVPNLTKDVMWVMIPEGKDMVGIIFGDLYYNENRPDSLEGDKGEEFMTFLKKVGIKSTASVLRDSQDKVQTVWIPKTYIKFTQYDSNNINEVNIAPAVQPIVVRNADDGYGDLLYFKDNPWIPQDIATRVVVDDRFRPNLISYLNTDHGLANDPIDEVRIQCNTATDARIVLAFLKKKGMKEAHILKQGYNRVIALPNKYLKIIMVNSHPYDLNESLLKEYSDKVIKDLLTKWNIAEKDHDVVKRAIQAFENSKDSLRNRLDILVLPDELKQNNKYLDITQYSYDDFVKLMKSIPESPEKIKKAAIRKFVEDEKVDKATAQSYTARFMNNKDNLKYGVANGMEDKGFSKEEVLKLIPPRLLNNNAFLDPNNWKWRAFEQMLDALFPSFKKAEETGENTAQTDADKIYDKGGIEVYKCDAHHKCVEYNPTVDGKKMYSWCVAQPGSGMYDSYRLGDKSPTFYFIFDRSIPSDRTANGYRFEHPFHAMALQVNSDGKTYVLTDANNSGDRRVDSWEDLSKITPPETWEKIKGLQPLISPVALTGPERAKKMEQGRLFTVDEFKELDQQEKKDYISGKAPKNQISRDILRLLPKYKIKEEGKTTTLANVAIDAGQRFTYADLKDNEQLAKRYAIFRFKHTNFGKEPIPLPFIKYLDDEAKVKYLKEFEKQLNFDYIKRYFGDNILTQYVNEKAKSLDYIPDNYLPYITDSKYKKIAEVYFKLFKNWKEEDEKEFNKDEEELENEFTAPLQTINPHPLTQDDWKALSSEDQSNIITILKQVNGKEQYSTLLYALPFMLVDGSNEYLLLPTSASEDAYYTDWVLTDLKGNTVKNVTGDDLEIDGDTITRGFPPIYDGKYTRIAKLSDLTIDSNPIALKESMYNDTLMRRAGIVKQSTFETPSYNDWDKYTLMRRAGIIK